MGVPMTDAEDGQDDAADDGVGKAAGAAGGGVLAVKTSRDSPEKPFQSSVARISTSQIAPNAVAATKGP